MNNFLKSAVKRFSEKFPETFLINPISVLDAEIMIEIIEIIKKLGDTGAPAILKRYKDYKDEDIRDQLMQYNLDLNANFDEDIDEKGNKKEKERKWRDYISFRGVRMEVAYIHNWQPEDRYNELERRMDFGILVNKVDADSDRQPMSSNIFFPFEFEELRDEYLLKLDETLREHFNIVNIL